MNLPVRWLLQVLALLASISAAPSEPESGGQRGRKSSEAPDSTQAQPPSTSSAVSTNPTSPLSGSTPTSSQSTSSKDNNGSTTGATASTAKTSIASTQTAVNNGSTTLSAGSGSRGLTTGDVGGLVAATVVGTAAIVLVVWLLYKRHLRKSQQREVDLISHDEVRSVNRDSPAAAINPFSSGDSNPDTQPYGHNGTEVNATPSSPAMSQAPDIRSLSLSFSHVPSAMYDNPMTPSSIKTEQANMAGPSAAGPSGKAIITRSTLTVEETGSQMQEIDAGISLMSSSEDGASRQTVPPAYEDYLSDSHSEPRSGHSSTIPRSPFE